MRIVDLKKGDVERVQEVANIVVDGFRATAPEAWPTIESALEEINDSFKEGRISRVAVDDDGHVLGWIGALEGEYDNHVWKLHPLVVDTKSQAKGIGTALVADLEEQIADRGGITVSLGSDDETNQTSLSGIDLYPDVIEHILNIRNLNRHPYEFYQKQGYVITGVVPDANGWGKPDILMVKRLVAWPKGP